MMKKLRQWLLPLFALLLTAAGAALPYMAAAAQDAQVGNMRENRLLDAVDLTLRKAGDARDMLKLPARPGSLWTWRWRPVSSHGSRNSRPGKKPGSQCMMSIYSCTAASLWSRT